MQPELNVPTRPRRFDPAGRPRTWLLNDERHRTTLAAEGFAELAKAFKAEPDGAA